MSVVVTHKGGTCEWGVKRLAGFIDGLGYNKVMFKSDNEPSIVDLWNAVREKRKGDTIPENAPVGESEANGIAEKAVQEFEGMMRTNKSALEEKIGVRIKTKDYVTQWMVEHASTIMNRCKVGVDGMTPFERIRGKPNKKKFCGFGEVVLYMPVKPKSEKGDG